MLPGDMTQDVDPREFVLVIGAGRSGTSLTAGVFHRLGFDVPQPEVEANKTNPRGFGEPRWVVNFHAKLMANDRIGSRRMLVMSKPGPNKRVR